MKLNELPRNTYFTIVDENPRVPPGAPIMDQNTVYWFGHIDGMYSYCKDIQGNLVHLAAWTEVNPVPAP